MRRPATELPFTCTTCEAAIGPRPVFHVGLPFCCAGCVAGGPCLCSYDASSVRGSAIGLGHGPAGDRTLVVDTVR